jgi:mycoredoxin
VGIGFVFCDIHADEAAAATSLDVSGTTASPVLVFDDGSYLVEPSDAELARKLGHSLPGWATSQGAD